MGLCHSTVGFTEARANYLPVNKKKMGKLSIWGDITAFEWAWTKKKITKNPEKENKNMGDRKNSGYKQVLQRKHWNCAWESLVEMLRQSGLCLWHLRYLQSKRNFIWKANAIRLIKWVFTRVSDSSSSCTSLSHFTLVIFSTAHVM